MWFNSERDGFGSLTADRIFSVLSFVCTRNWSVFPIHNARLIRLLRNVWYFPSVVGCNGAKIGLHNIFFPSIKEHFPVAKERNTIP